MAYIAVLLVLIVFLSPFIDSTIGAKQSYVVYLGGQHDENLEHEVVADSHHVLLGSILGSKEVAKEAIFYSYTRSINGFAANLEEKHAHALSELPQVLSVFVNRARTLHTTNSWGFLGLDENGGGDSETEVIPRHSLWRNANFGKDVIVANLDTGVWPESKSFDDTGYGPVPSRWKGICQAGTDFTAAQCNRKLIGARYFVKGYEDVNGPFNITGDFLSPRDADGHGTHTLSTAGGNFVKNASINGYAKGIAKGGAPHARVAAYKVCWDSCYDADIVAAFDAGIHDGVDVFSISLGSDPDADYFVDALAIASFHAVQRGRVVVCSAGNSGPDPGTVENVAPWIITVGASSINRQFLSGASLGNKRTYVGQSVSKFRLPEKKLYPLVSSSDIRAPNINKTSAQVCLPGSLDPQKAKGKIVACLRGIHSRVEKGETVREAGGLGLILANDVEDGNEVFADAHILPATHLTGTDGVKVFKYIKSTVSPVAYISPPSTKWNVKPAPVMADFSSQGPNRVNPGILKPDITAPGLNILAAYSMATSTTGLSFDNSHVPFNVMSGTSMSCPHVAGVAASLKGAHPHWSPAEIKSAIMTTATKLNNKKEPIENESKQTAGPFSYGAGHVNPNGAGNPGLVYDLSLEDYYNFFCTLNYNSTEIRAIIGKEFTCPARRSKIHNFNYPSITVAELHGTAIVKRTLKNVAEGHGTYKAQVTAPPGVLVSLNPTQLEFSKKGEKKSFTITFNAANFSGNYVFGSLSWNHHRFSVVSPIVVGDVTVKRGFNH